MKITKQGQLPDKTILEGKCRYCKTEFECEQGEALYRFDQRDGDFFTIDCPLCLKQVVIPAIKRSL